MIKKPTNELMDALTRNSSIDGYLNKEKEFLIDMSVSEMLGFLLQEKNLQKSAVIKKAQLNEIYGYQILAGKRMPSRDKLIALAFGMELSLEETQQLLKYAGFSTLSKIRPGQHYHLESPTSSGCHPDQRVSVRPFRSDSVGSCNTGFWQSCHFRPT